MIEGIWQEGAARSNVVEADRRSVGWPMWESEIDGVILAPPALQSFRANLNFTNTEIGLAFELFVDPRTGQSLGGSLGFDDITAAHRDELRRAGLAHETVRRWEWTEKGKQLQDLLDEYASPAHRFKSLVFRG